MCLIIYTHHKNNWSILGALMTLHWPACITCRQNMVWLVNGESERMWKEVVVCYFKVLRQLDKNRKHFHSGKIVTWLRFEPGTSAASSRCANHSTATFGLIVKNNTADVERRMCCPEQICFKRRFSWLDERLLASQKHKKSGILIYLNL